MVGKKDKKQTNKKPANAGDERDQVPLSGQKDPLEKGMATLSHILPGESHGQRRQAVFSSQGLQELDKT